MFGSILKEAFKVPDLTGIKVPKDFKQKADGFKMPQAGNKLLGTISKQTGTGLSSMGKPSLAGFKPSKLPGVKAGDALNKKVNKDIGKPLKKNLIAQR